MKKNYSIFSLSILATFYSASSAADLTQQCLQGVPQFRGEVVQGNLNELPVYIESDKVTINQPSNALYEGNVDIKQGNRHLVAQAAEVTQGTSKQSDRYAYVRDGFSYQDNLINLQGDNAKIDLNSKDTDIEKANYQFVGRQGRGDAQNVALRDTYREMRNAEFTSCLQNDNSWSIKAKEMRQHIQDEYAEMWHARFLVHGVPIFYTPYLQIPIGDRRRSGLLMPAVGGSSRDGYFYEQPIYWNIAPNLDATFAPKYMSRRGWQLKGETRYLTAIGEGSIAGEYLAYDRLNDYLQENKSRHLFYWKHHSSFLQNWRLDLDYTRVSDKRYFDDISSDYGSSTDGYANQIARIAYYQPNYNVAISTKQFQVFDIVDIGPYRTLPQLDFNYYKNDLAKGWLDFKLFSQAVRFDNDSKLMPTAWRFHLEPSLNAPLSNQYGSLNLETKLYATRYLQKKGSSKNAEEVQRSVTRVLPQFKVDLQTVLATNKTLLKDYTQTIEPRVQYLYRPYRNQSNIGSKLNSEYLGFGYDSSLLQQDYFSLFRDRRYSGLDRIASANQVTLGGTTRFYDEKANERFNLSIGQTYYLTTSRIDDEQDNSSNGTSSWALESNWKISDKWNWRGSYQYDTRLKEASLANTSLEFNPEKNNLVQLNYRFTSRQYIDQNLSANSSGYKQDIKQLGLTVAWELGDNWAVVGRYYQDLALRKPVEQYLGVQYNSCCWSVGVGARRYLTSKANQTYQRERDVFYDNSISVTFELRGLNQSHSSGVRSMLEKGMLPYINPFNL